MGICLEGLNGDESPDIEWLIQPGDLPILQAFMQELEHWPELDRWYAKGATKIAKHAQALDQSIALWGSESAIQG